MVWLLGKIIKVVLILAIAAALIAVAVVMFVNPNDFKEEITNALKSYTGQEFVINGNVQWTLKPEVALYIENIDINNDSNIQQLVVFLDPFSLFANTLLIEKLQINQATFSVNLASLRPAVNNKTTQDSTNQQTGAQTQISKRKSKNANIKATDIKEAKVLIIDKENNINWELRNINVDLNNLVLNGANKFAPFALQAELLDLEHKQTFTIDSTVNLGLQEHTVDLDPLSITWNGVTFTGSLDVSEYNTHPIFSSKLNLEGTETAELLQHLNPYYKQLSPSENHTLGLDIEFKYHTQGKILDVTTFNLNIDEGALHGTYKLGFTIPYQANFELMANDMNFEPIISIARSMFPTTPAEHSLAYKLVQDVTMSGKFIGKNLVLSSNFQLDQISFQTIVQDQKLQVSPITFGAFGSLHNMSLYVDMTNDMPFVQMTEQADNVDFGKLITLFGAPEVLTGTASIKANLEATGNNLNTLISSLTGGINMNLRNGRYYGLNLDELANFEINLIKSTFKKLANGQINDLKSYLTDQSSKWIDTQQQNPFTEFSTADFKAKFNVGVSKDSSISLITRDYSLKANGSIDLANDSMNIIARITGNREPKIEIVKLAKYLQETPFTMSITGSPTNPIYGPEIRQYTITSIELLLKASMETATTKMVEATPPNQKTDQSANELFVNSLQVLKR